MKNNEILDQIKEIVKETEDYIQEQYDKSTLEEPIMNDIILVKVNMSYHNIAKLIKSKKEDD